jgi:hypothetical protein
MGTPRITRDRSRSTETGSSSTDAATSSTTTKASRGARHIGTTCACSIEPPSRPTAADSLTCAWRRCRRGRCGCVTPRTRMASGCGRCSTSAAAFMVHASTSTATALLSSGVGRPVREEWKSFEDTHLVTNAGTADRKRFNMRNHRPKVRSGGLSPGRRFRALVIATRTHWRRSMSHRQPQVTRRTATTPSQGSASMRPTLPPTHLTGLRVSPSESPAIVYTLPAWVSVACIAPDRRRRPALSPSNGACP